jgi:purine-binding chemotaxis protein CheW
MKGAMNALLDPVVAPTARLDLSGKYLTFVLGNESYGIPVLKIREIISMLHTTPVPQMPAYVKGVINLRGKVIPVIDLRVKFCLRNANVTESTCIVVVQAVANAGETKQIGLIVDAVEEVANIPQADIEPAPDFGGTVEVDYILGMAKVKGAVKSLLAIDKVIAADTIERLEASIAD